MNESALSTLHKKSRALDSRSEAEASPRGDARDPRAWIVTRYRPRVSEPWIDRQVRGFTRVDPASVCWAEDEDAGAGSNGDSPPERYVLGLDPLRDQRRVRWLDRLRNAPSGNFVGASGSERRVIRRLISKDRPDVILAHFGHIALRILPAAKRAGVPVVAHFHGLDVSSSLRNRWYRWSLKNALVEFAQIVVVGSHQRRRLIDLGAPADRVHVIPCGVPTDEFVPRAPTDGAAVRFVCVCRLVEWKGVAQSLQALTKVRQTVPNASLIVIGDGPDRPALEATAKDLGIESAVEFRGALPPHEVARALQDADVLLQHSIEVGGWIEGFGVCMAEAAATGLPVIATRHGGIVDQVVDGETGVLVEEHDVEGMAKAMACLANNSDLRRQMGEAGRERMVEHFDTTKQVRELEDVMLSAANQLDQTGAR